LVKLASLPTPELIVQAGDLSCPRPMDDRGNKRMRQSMSGAIAAQKILAYLEAVRDVENFRQQVSQEISRLKQEERRLTALRSVEAANLMAMASHLAGRQEVAFHFFAVAVGRIERLLPFAAKAVGYKIPKDDLEQLKSYRVLPDYYEHFEDYLPGRQDPRQEGITVVTEEEVGDEWRSQLGFSIDDQERVVIGGKTVDVTGRGLAAVEAVLRRNWEALHPSALQMVRSFFEANPSDVPGPEAVRSKLLASTGGSGKDGLG
jgi:hypothetical protein